MPSTIKTTLAKYAHRNTFLYIENPRRNDATILMSANDTK